MPSKQQLSAIKVKNIKEPGYFLDSDGLYLQVSSTGTKSWVYRFMLKKRRRDMGLGPLDTLSLADARLQRNEQKKLVKQGIDPIANRTTIENQQIALEQIKQRESITFKICAKEYINAKQAEWKNSKSAQQWNSTLRDYAHPFIGHLPVSQIDQSLVLKCLKPIWESKTETATRLRQRIENILDYAKAKNYRNGDNPAALKGGLQLFLPRASKIKETKNHSALPYRDIPAFISQLKTLNGQSVLALRLTILTAARTSETLNAQWCEINLAERTWIIPKERMKAGKEHRIALSQTAIDLIQSLPRVNLFLFPGAKQGKPLSNMAMAQALKRINRRDITVHGFRSTFRDWVAEKTNFPARVAETALAHQLKDATERAYQRGDLIEKRFEMMEAWASYCESRNAKIIRLPA